MAWTLPSHNLICGDTKGNIALQVSGWAPTRDGFTGRLPVPGTGKYEWKGRRNDMPRSYNPARGYIATANDNTQITTDFKGPPVFYNTTKDVDIARITRIHQLLDKQIAEHKPFTIADMERIQAADGYSLHAERDAPLFKEVGRPRIRMPRRKAPRPDRGMGPDPHREYEVGRDLCAVDDDGCRQKSGRRQARP